MHTYKYALHTTLRKHTHAHTRTHTHVHKNTQATSWTRNNVLAECTPHRKRWSGSAYAKKACCPPELSHKAMRLGWKRCGWFCVNVRIYVWMCGCLYVNVRLGWKRCGWFCVNVRVYVWMCGCLCVNVRVREHGCVFFFSKKWKNTWAL